MNLDRKYSIPLGLCLVASLLLFVRGRLLPVSLEAEASHFLDCEAAGNAGCMMPYLRPEEARAYGIDEHGLHALLGSYVNSSFLKATGTPATEVTPSKGFGELSYVRRWKRSDGDQPLQRGVTVVATNDGTKVADYIRNLIIDSMYARYRQKSDQNTYVTIIRGIDHDRKTLTGLGIKGFYDLDSDLVVDWDTVRAKWAEKLKARGIAVPKP